MTKPHEHQAPLLYPEATAAFEFVCQVEAGWQTASSEQLAGWHGRLADGLANLRAAHARTAAAAEAGTLNPAQPAVLDAYLRIAPAVTAHLETLLTNVATRLDALASAA